MFVASRVESGDEGKAVVALLPHVIGHIQTTIGCGTLRRASGIAVQVVVGDPVCQGDVIETAADGRIGIRFIDGTVFNLFNSTRVVLNEFVCDSNGSSHSALFGVTRGTFAFIAGEVAKTGCLRIDTPVGSIRGRAHTGGIGMLSLVALTFSILKEVQAADSNVTFLDDDSITYKDLEHGAFELVTKEAIPRHIIVEDPGETIVLSAKGSTISVNQVANTATRMAELQAAQQDVLANFAKGFGPNGSSTPAFGNPLKLQPINFIQTNDPPAPQNSLPPLPWLVDSTAMLLIVHTPPPPPSLNAVTGPTEIDTAAFDFFTATSGTLLASSPNDGATLTYGISGGTAGSTVLDGVTYDVSKTGPYGTLYVNSTTGAYTFVPDSGAINALTTTTTASFTVTVSDGTLSANQTFTVTIHGTNDPAIISGTVTGSVIEAGGVANATPGTPTATGTLTDTDVDNTPNTFTAVTSPTASAGGYGTFTMTAAGVWTYTLDNANCAVQALNACDTLTDTFTVTTVDGTAQVVTIAIHGASDADPNDFDYLATGTHVISDPPYVYGTPGGDSIAGGGDEGQIIYGGAGNDTLNGTGKSDIIYAGSGNDTVKGNDGDDTIYGGSGSDTINANNGNDTIVGGFGADHLTGSNGDDRFVYLSVADSNAAQFDTISDFKSGSDRIDLAALGALAILALTSTSTSVPAHTIAWLYDSASNETIVYVNPTDQTLSIGNSGLLEIHLQGIVTIQASDFIYEPTTAPVVLASDSIDLAMAATADGTVVTTTSAVVSSDSTVSDGALIVDWNWTVQTTKEGFSFDAARDQIDSIGHARFTSSDEVRTQPTEYTDDDAVIALASGQSIELQRVHVTAPMENNFAFDQSLVLDSAGAMTIGNGAVMAQSGTIHSTAALNAAGDRAELQLIKHGLALEDGDRIVPSHSDKINSGTSSIAANNEDHGALKASENGGGGNHSISGEASEHGTAPMHGAGAPDFEPSSTAHAASGSGAAGTLGLGDSFHFKDKISGFEGSGVIDLADVDHAPASISHRENAAGTRGPEGAQTTELSLPGQHSADNFSIVPDHAGGTVVTHVHHDLMV